MTLPNNKAKYGDRISELPGNVIDCILQHMIVRDLVRTSILSKNWRYMWTSVPRIEFDDRFYDLFDRFDDPASEFSRIITEILFLHNGPIHEFCLQLPCTSKNKITFQYLNKWILYLSRKPVKYIYLANDGSDLVRTPSHLFSCLELTSFKLHQFNLSIPHNFRGFKNLLHLDLLCVTFELGALQTLLSGCPLLESLSVLYCSGCECIDLSSVPTLIDLNVLLPQKCIFGLNKSLPIVQRLTLELLDKMLLFTDIFPLSQLIMSLKYLYLDEVNLDEREEFLYIVRVFKSASNLIELDIVTSHGTNYDTGYRTQAPDPSEKLECSSSFLSQLQTVKITVETGFKHAMSLTRVILASSSSLKTLTFGYHEEPEASILSSISQDLLWMERASQRAHVEFIHR